MRPWGWVAPGWVSYGDYTACGSANHISARLNSPDYQVLFSWLSNVDRADPNVVWGVTILCYSSLPLGHYNCGVFIKLYYIHQIWSSSDTLIRCCSLCFYIRRTSSNNVSTRFGVVVYGLSKPKMTDQSNVVEPEQFVTLCKIVQPEPYRCKLFRASLLSEPI